MTISNPENEYLVNYLVVLNKAGRRFSSEADNRWGGLILPAPGENPARTGEGLKVALFVSWKFGYILLETLKRFENKFPQKLNLVGVVTDNPLNPEAKISKKKRIWSSLGLPVQVVHETSMIEAGLSHGTPVYTGEIKIESFRRILQQWDPDVILVCVFGQIIDSFIINYPAGGIFNFHPSDLAQHHGAGPNPYQDLRERGADTTVWTIHCVNEEVDAGHIVGQSPLIMVKNFRGQLPDNPLVVWEKVSEAVSPVGLVLVQELCRRFEKGETRALESLDIEGVIPREVKNKFMLPVDTDTYDDLLPEPGSPVFTSMPEE